MLCHKKQETTLSLPHTLRYCLLGITVGWRIAKQVLRIVAQVTMNCFKPIISSLCSAGSSSPATVSPLTQVEDPTSVPEFRLAPATAPQTTVFPSPPNTCAIDVVRVLTVHGHSGGKKMWSYLAKHWTDHGSVAIDVTSVNTFDLELLQRENPDVIVCSDIAGAPYQLSTGELNSLRAFVTETTGKHVLGTYATFYHREGTPNNPSIYDNRRLAPLFGFHEETDFGTRRVSQSPVFEPSVCNSTSHHTFSFTLSPLCPLSTAWLP